MCRSILNPPPALPFEYCSELLSLLPHLDVLDKNNILEPSVPLMLPTQGKIDILVRGDSGFECFRYVFQHFIVLFDRLIAFLFATCTLCCIRPCISKRHMLEGLMNYSFPNNTALTPIRFQRGEVWYLFCKHCFLSFLCVLSLASWFFWVKETKIAAAITRAHCLSQVSFVNNLGKELLPCIQLEDNLARLTIF